MQDALDLLKTRRSVKPVELSGPSLSAGEIDTLLTIASRVPDHGKLVPWRLVVIRGDARAKLGNALADMHLRHEPGVPPAVIDKDRSRFNFAPLIVTVVARIEDDHPKVPAQEQLLSAGLIAYNLLLGAQELGFGAQWLTGWSAYDREAASLLGLADNERVVAFVHIGTAREAAPERTRPALDDVLSEWR